MPKPRSIELKKEAMRAARLLKKTPAEALKSKTYIFEKPGDYNDQEFEPEEVAPYNETIPGVLERAGKALKPRYEGMSKNLLSPGILGRIGPMKVKAGLDINPREPKRSVLGVKGRMAF